MIKQMLLETITASLLIGTAGDLLYLYWAGGWQEPCVPILISEIAILIATIGLGIWRVSHFISKLQGRKMSREPAGNGSES